MLVGWLPSAAAPQLPLSCEGAGLTHEAICNPEPTSVGICGVSSQDDYSVCCSIRRWPWPLEASRTGVGFQEGVGPAGEYDVNVALCWI